MTSKDKFGIPYFHPLKSGGFAYESSDDPKSDDPFESGNETKTTGTNEVTMSPNGPTNFHLGKNARKFKDSIGGCKLKFPDAEGRGYAAFKDDVRDVMIRGLFWFDLGSNGFSISACTGHHTTPKPCCQGHAYMITIEPSQNPYGALFRKEMWHVSYHPSPGSGKNGFDLTGLTSDKQWVGIGFCRYNDPSAPDKNVIVEVWINTHPESDIGDWKMIRSEVDKPGHGWGNNGDQCGGDKDQVITWSGPKNRFKTNATSGKVKAKMLSMFEIDPTGTGGVGGQPPGEPPQPPTTGTISRDWTIKYNIIAFGDDACGVGTTTTTLNTFYNVTDNGSQSNLHRDRYRACMFANGSVSLFIGKKPRRVKVMLSKSGSPPAGDITCVLRKGSDDESGISFSYVGGPSLNATDLTTVKTQYTFENLTSNYVWQNGDKLCIEYSGNTTDTTNEINVWRNTNNPYDGQASCAIKFDVGGPPPESYSAPDTSRDYAMEISEVGTAEEPVTPVTPVTFKAIYTLDQNGSSTLNDTLKRYGELVATNSSMLSNRMPAYVEVWLAKSGSPTGNVSVTIRKGTDDSVAHTFGTKDAATLTTTLTKYKFDTNINTSYRLSVGDRIMVEYTGGTSSNTVKVGRNTQTATTSYDGIESIRIQFTTVYDGGSADRDLAAVVWEQQ